MTKKVLFINQEIAPYVPESTLSVSGRDLPQKMQENGFEIRMFMPKWGIINERRGQLHEVIRLSGMNLIIDDTDHPLIIKVASLPQSRLQVYFIDNDDYFYKRGMGKDEQGEYYSDNGERALFFSRGVLETVKKLRWIPDVVVCQGWMGAIVPLYIKEMFKEEPCFANAKVVTSLFGDMPEGVLGEQFNSSIDFRQGSSADVLANYAKDFDYKELMKLAIDNSDAVIEGTEGADSDAIAYAEQSGKPFLSYTSEDNEAAYKEFIESL